MGGSPTHQQGPLPLPGKQTPLRLAVSTQVAMALELGILGPRQVCLAVPSQGAAPAVSLFKKFVFLFFFF